MKTKFAVSIMGLAVTIAMGVVGVQAFSESDSEIPTLSSSGLNLLGHATFTVLDSDGNIKAYKQSDNAIITTGKDCVGRLLFDNATTTLAGTNVCSSLTAGFTGFKYIGVANQTAAVTTLTSAATLGSDFAQDMSTAGALPRYTAVPSFTAASGATTGTIVTLATNAMTISSAVGSTNVTTSALLDDSTQGTDVAAAIIAIPNGVQVAQGDQLTVTWSVTIG